MENLSSTIPTVHAISHLMTSHVDPMTFDDVILFRKIILVFWISFSVGGIFTNVINVLTFIRMGLDDSVTISFFALAVCDFFNCTLMFLEIGCLICEFLEWDFNFWFRMAPSVVSILADVIRKGFASKSILITTFLAVQRCLCVLIPFHVKGMFTKSKTYCFLLVSFFACFIPIALTFWRFRVIEKPHYNHRMFNATQRGLYILPSSEPYFHLTDVLLGIVVNFGGQIIIVLCLIVISVTLKKSLRFKQTAKAVSVTKAIGERKDNPGNTKELQALKQIGFISLIFVCTNTPYFVHILVRTCVPQFGLYKAYHYLYLFVYVPLFVTEMLGSAMNFFVYYKYNTKFRDVCVISPKILT